jgi:hypothetical protein
MYSFKTCNSETLLLDSGRLSPNQEIVALDMTNDHNPQLLAEANRVLAAGVITKYLHF